MPNINEHPCLYHAYYKSAMITTPIMCICMFNMCRLYVCIYVSKYKYMNIGLCIYLLLIFFLFLTHIVFTLNHVKSLQMLNEPLLLRIL